MGRTPCCDKTSVKKGPWSPEEDAKLKSYIEKHGMCGNWIALPQKIGLRRCGKSCRLRWLNYLRPNIRHGGFSEEEDYIICSLYVSIGSRWSIIASQLPGRTDNDIKNYWNTRLKKKFLGYQSNGNGSERNHSHYINTVKREPNKDSMTTSSMTRSNHNIHDHGHEPYWAMEVPNNLHNRSPYLKDSILELDGRFSNEEDKQRVMVDNNSSALQHLSSSSSSSSSMEYHRTPHVLFQTQFCTKHTERGFQAMQEQSEIIKHNDEFPFSDAMSCGESNTGSWGYFTSLMTLPPSWSFEDYNFTMNP